MALVQLRMIGFKNYCRVLNQKAKSEIRSLLTTMVSPLIWQVCNAIKSQSGMIINNNSREHFQYMTRSSGKSYDSFICFQVSLIKVLQHLTLNCPIKVLHFSTYSCIGLQIFQYCHNFVLLLNPIN